MMDKNIGFIGTGIMGLPMASNLLKGGCSLTVFNRTAGKADDLRQMGAEIASQPLQIGQTCDTVILMLTGPDAIEAILWGENGLLAEGSRCTTVINMSTVSPMYSRDLNKRLAQKDVVLVDAPVSGSKKPAEDGTLVILAGGPQDAVASLEPIFLKMGQKVVYCGEAGTASTMKMVVNLLLGTMIGGLSEALTLGEKCGLSKEKILATVLAGPLSCGLFSLKEPMLASGEYPVQFPFKHMLKDLNFILETAEDAKADIKIGRTLQQLYAAGMDMGCADLDFAAVKKVVELL